MNKTPAPAVKRDNVSIWDGGIADYDKAAQQNEAAFMRSVDYRTHPRELTVLTKTTKESATTVVDLPKDGDKVGNDVYYYGSSGNIYRRTAFGLHTNLRTVANSHGNGMKYYTEDSFLYYTSDKVIGRYGYLPATPISYDNWVSGIDSSRWGRWGGSPTSITTSGNTLTVASTLANGYYGIEQTGYNLTNSYITAQVTDVGSRTLTSWEVYPCYALINNSNQLFWYIDNANVLRAYKKVAGVNTILASGTYSSTTHRYFRIRESGGTVYFDYSSDFTTWVNFASTANPFAVTALYVGMYAGTYNTELSTTSASFGVFTTGIGNPSPVFTDDFLGSEGGVPLNTGAISLVSASSQHGTRADTASLSIVSDIAMEATIKPSSLPAVGSSMVLASKWDVNGNIRSYKFEIYAVSGVFGDGSDGALTVSGDTTEAPIDAACTGTVGSTSLFATNASFVINQQILVHQTQGSGAGTQMRNKIVGYTAGTITLETPLNATYVTGAQVRVLKQYTSVTVNTGITYSAKAWNGSVGGILAFIANGTVSIVGTMLATAKGFRATSTTDITGGSETVSRYGEQGEGTGGTGGTRAATANGNGGAGGGWSTNSPWTSGHGGGGGGNASAGTTGRTSGGGNNDHPGGVGGSATSSTDLVTMTPGGAGGMGGMNDTLNNAACSSTGGGAGGGIIYIIGATVTNTGTIITDGNQGLDNNGSYSYFQAAGGGGAGGSVLIKGQTVTLGTIYARGGRGGYASWSGSASVSGDNDGGAGSNGVIHLDYLTSYTSGTYSPTASITQDSSLVSTTTYQLRLGISSTGTNEEFLTRNATLITGRHTHVAVSWKASTSTATFFVDGVTIGFATGTLTAINDNASRFAVGADYSTTARNFYNGIIDEVRIWNTERTADQFLANKSVQIATNSTGLVGYYKFNQDATDSTANANDLTATGSPTYTTDVAFSSPTTRLDIDQSSAATGQTYTTPTAISESAKLSFVPQKDPQKSILFNVVAKGTGAWTVTIHDSSNRVLAVVTVTNANMATGDYEFTFPATWTPVKGATYHAHVTSTVADGTVTTGVASDVSTAQYKTFYQFLVTDSDYHPVEQMLNFLAIGNGRYVATYAADAGYTPHKLSLPSGWKVRCFAKWREYLAIGCWQGSSIYDTDKGIIFFWDGYSTTYNFYVEVAEGAVNAMLANRDLLYVWAGYHGDLLSYRGLYGDTAQNVKRMPKMAANKYMETMPKAVGMYDALLRWGAAGNSNSSDVERGIYTWGRRKASNQESLSYDYPISTGSRASTGVQIGFIMPIDRKLLIGWKDSTSYGMDVMDPTGNFYPTATYEKDIKDYGAMWKQKKAMVVRADFKRLATGEQVRVKYKLDRASDWTAGDYVTSSVEDTTVARLPIDFGNHKEAQIAADLVSPGTTAPTILELTLEEDMKATENIF